MRSECFVLSAQYSVSAMLRGVFFRAIGLEFLIYWKRQQTIVPPAAGIALFVHHYFM